MANTILTPTAVTRAALAILHQKVRFIGSINRQYDDQFAISGAKIGDTLKIRLPNQYTVSTGATLSVQDTAETSVSLQIATQKHVDVNFGMAELTLSLQDFSQRILQPAMSVLAAAIEADALSMVKQVANFVDDDGNPFSFLTMMKAKQKLDESLAWEDEDRTLLLCPTHSTKAVDAMKGLFNAPNVISKNYVQGTVGQVAGFDNIMQSTLLTAEATGTAAKTTGYTVNGATESGASITIQTGTTTFLVGDVVTFVGSNAVHDESKADLGYLKQFTVTANSGASAVTLAISPSLVVSGARQNVTAYPTNTGAVVKVGAGVSETYTQSIAYHKNAFAIAFADLLDVSQFGAWGSRQVLDGISMRIAKQYDITNDKLPCRIDVLYGYKAIRPQVACRLHADG